MSTDLEKSSSKLLKGNLGTIDIVCTVIAFNGPFVVFTGLIPVIISSGNTLGAAMIFAICGAALLLFSVGFTEMARFVPNPGGFYAFISAGIGKPLGLGGSFLSVLCYYAIVINLYSFFGVMGPEFVSGVLHGPELSPFVFSFGLLIIVAILGFFQISVSAKVLTVFMAAEMLILLVFSVVSVVSGGAEGVTYEPINPGSLIGANIGLALLFGFICYGGFETTVIYREEAREPHRTIPHATYLAVIILTLLFMVVSWGFVVAVGPSGVLAASAEDPTGTAMGALAAILGTFVQGVGQVLVLTSIFACALSTHNVAARYKFSLSVDGVLPRRLGAVHPKHGSPHVSSVVCSVISVVAMVVAFAAKLDLIKVFVTLAAVGAYGLLVLQTITSVAVIVYFRSNPQFGANRWRNVIAPALSSVALAVAVVLATWNFDFLVGGSVGFAALVLGVLWAALLVGVVLAVRLKRTSPEIYARIGRQIPVAGARAEDEGDAVPSGAH